MSLIFFSLAVSIIVLCTCVFNELVYAVLPLQNKKKYERLVPSFCFILFVLNVIVFVYNRLKQSLILYGKNKSLYCTEIVRNTWSDCNSIKREIKLMSTFLVSREKKDVEVCMFTWNHDVWISNILNENDGMYQFSY